MNPSLFQSFFMGGFECSTHRTRSGRRLDLIDSTQHDRFAFQDYRLLMKYGLRTARDGVRWHLMEREPGRYDWSVAEPMFRAAQKSGLQVVWDLWHYGWPDDLDLFSPEFAPRFGAFAGAVAQKLLELGDETPMFSPVNEISFFSWAAGDGRVMYPYAEGRGMEIKRQLVRASVAAIKAIKRVNPAARFLQVDPMINVISRRDDPEDAPAAELQRLSQFEVWDMMCGRLEPELGGKPAFLDVIGVNYYIHNQWKHPGGDDAMIVPSDPRYRHVRDMLREISDRYDRPILIAETGIEDETRPAWLRYISNEAAAAIAQGVPLEGICLYPVLNHPGWEDDRHCYNGLFDYANEEGEREVYLPLAAELARQQKRIAAIRSGKAEFHEEWDASSSQLDWAAHLMSDRTEASREPTA